MTAFRIVVLLLAAVGTLSRMVPENLNLESAVRPLHDQSRRRAQRRLSPSGRASQRTFLETWLNLLCCQLGYRVWDGGTTERT